MSTEYLTFKVSNQNFCLPLLNIKEIITHRESSPVPGSPGFVEGVIYLREELITVVDTKTIFNIFDDVAPTHIVILDFTEGYLGLSVDAIEGVVKAEDTDFNDMNKLFSKGSHYLNGVVKVKDRLFNSFSISALNEIISEDAND